MKLEEIIEILKKKEIFLREQRIYSANIGDIAEVTRIDIELQEIKNIIKKLED